MELFSSNILLNAPLHSCQQYGSSHLPILASAEGLQVQVGFGVGAGRSGVGVVKNLSSFPK